MLTTSVILPQQGETVQLGLLKARGFDTMLKSVC
jgi:hypothetical protein